MSLTMSTPTTSSLPQGRRAARLSGAVWFLSGVAATVLGIAVLATAVVAMMVLRTGSTQPSEMARLVAAPLVPEGTSEPTLSGSEIYAAVSSRISEAERIGERGGELAPVAWEYVEALRTFHGLLSEAPSSQPLLRAGLETWQGSLDDDDAGFLFGLLGVGSELSKLSEFSAKLSDVHSRIVACRLRVAEMAVQRARLESSGNTVSAAFSEARGLSTVSNDTLALRNISGQRLTNVMVLTELTGQNGERFSNLYFADRWEPNQVVLAVCRSESPTRETVHNVTKVRFRVIADELASSLGELTVGH